MEAVGGTNRKLEVADWLIEAFVGIDFGDFLDLGNVDGFFIEIDEERNLFLEDFSSKSDGIFGRNRTIGCDFEREFIVVGMLPDAGICDGVVDGGDGSEKRIDEDRPKGIIIAFIFDRTAITFTGLDAEIGDEMSIFAERTNDVIGIENFDIRGAFDIAGFDDTRTFLIDVNPRRFRDIRFDANLFDIHHDDDDVFANFGQSHEFMDSAFDFHGCDCGTLK